MAESLRIGVLGPVSEDNLESNLLRAISRLGHEAVPCGSFMSSQTSKSVARISKVARAVPAVSKLWQERLAASMPSDLDLLIVTTSTAPELLPEVVASMKAKSRFVVCWFVDAVSNFGHMRFVTAPYDRVFLTDKSLVKTLNATISPSFGLLPEGHDPEYHRPAGSPGTSQTVAVVGNFRPDRVALLTRLLNDGIPLRLFGSAVPNWVEDERIRRAHTGSWVVGIGKSQMFHGSAAVLNNLSPAVIDAVNCRVFEASAAGAVVVTEWRPMLGDVFDVGNELLAYQNYDELVSHLRDVLDQPNRFNQMREMAAIRADRDHKLDYRVAEMLNAVGL